MSWRCVREWIYRSIYSWPRHLFKVSGQFNAQAEWSLYHLIYTPLPTKCMNTVQHIFFPWRYSPNLGLGLPPWNFISLRFSRSQTVGRTPWAGDQLVARPLPIHKHRKTDTHTQTLNIHALSGIRASGFRASEDSACLRPLDCSDRRQTK
jgi:hypothetical protein